MADAKRRAVELKAAAEARLETERAHRSWVRLIILSWERDRARAGALLAGGLAYRVFLWQLAASLVIVAIVGIFSIATEGDPSEVMRDVGLTASVASAIGAAAADAGTSSWWLLFLGLWGILWAGRGAARALQVVSRIAFETTEPPRATATRASLTFNGLMFAALATQTVADDRLGSQLWSRLLVIVLTSVILFLLFVWAMSLLPHGDRSWRVVVPGAAVCAGSLLVMRVAVDLYFAGKVDRAEDIYGSIGIAVAILLALYLTARVFVLGVFGSATFAGVGGHGETFDVIGAVQTYGARTAGTKGKVTPDEPEQPR